MAFKSECHHDGSISPEVAIRGAAQGVPVSSLQWMLLPEASYAQRHGKSHNYTNSPLVAHTMCQAMS